MRWTYDAESDIASLDLVDHIAEGEIDQDVGPQLTPNRQWITMSYDLVGNLLSLELFSASKIVVVKGSTMPRVSLWHDKDEDVARMYFTDADVGEAEVMEIGPQLTPTGDKLVLGYDNRDHLVYIEIIGCSRVLRDDTLAAAQ